MSTANRDYSSVSSNSHGDHDSSTETYAKHQAQQEPTDMPNASVEPTGLNGDSAQKATAPSSATDRPGPTVQNRTLSNESWWSRRSSKLRNLSTPALAAPWILESDKTQTSNTARYDRHQTRKKLALNSLSHLLVTCVFCAGLVATLKGFQDRGTLDGRSKHVFNAIVTGLSLGVGINLSSSLKRYANMLRWRLLATGWKSLKEFELILSAESQVKVLQLLWDGRRRHGGFPYISRTQVICFLWLFLNLAAQILVALTGLTYSIDSSQKYVDSKSGYIQVADFTTIMHLGDNAPVTVASQQNAAQAFGIEGEDYGVGNLAPSDETSPESIYTDTNDDYWLVRLFEYNSENPNIDTPSDQYIETNASCTQYPIVGRPATNQTQITYTAQNSINVTVDIGETTAGSTTYVLQDYTSCGGRCATLLVYQAADDFDIINPAFFICKSVVSEIQGQSPSDKYVFSLPDLQASIFAGSIGSTGESGIQYQMYDSDSEYGSGEPVEADDVKVAISAFSADAIAAMAVNGPQSIVRGQEPVPALELDVQWKFFIPLISIIPFLQFVACLIVINWANKAIIRDDSYLAIAQLYRPVLEKMGQGGCVLTGEDIIDKGVFKEDRVAYGFTEPASTSDDHGHPPVRHIGIIFENDNSDHKPIIDRAWPDGLYNGPDDRNIRKRQRRMSI